MHIIKKIIYFLITIAILIKLIFISNYFLYYISYPITKNNKKSIDHFYRWKYRAEFLFQIIIALLLIIIFNPWYNNLRFINSEISTLFFIFAILLVITANWNDFYKNIKTEITNIDNKIS